MNISYSGGAEPRTAYEEQLAVEAALAEVQAGWDVEHGPDGTHSKPIAALAVTGEVAAGSLETAGMRSWDRTNGGVYDVTLTGTTNNLAQADGLAIESEIIRFSMAADRTLTGLKVADTSVFQRKYLMNGSGEDLSIPHNSGSSTSGYRFATPGNATYVLASGATVVALYDGSNNVWRIFGGTTSVTVQRDNAEIGNTLSSVDITFATAVNEAKSWINIPGSGHATVTGEVWVDMDTFTSTGVTVRREHTTGVTKFSYEVITQV